MQEETTSVKYLEVFVREWMRKKIFEHRSDYRPLPKHPPNLLNLPIPPLHLESAVYRQ